MKGRIIIYQETVVLWVEEVAEGVYMSNGSANAGNGEGGLKCDGIYMQGYGRDKILPRGYPGKQEVTNSSFDVLNVLLIHTILF